MTNEITQQDTTKTEYEKNLDNLVARRVNNEPDPEPQKKDLMRMPVSDFLKETVQDVNIVIVPKEKQIAMTVIAVDELNRLKNLSAKGEKFDALQSKYKDYQNEINSLRLYKRTKEAEEQQRPNKTNLRDQKAAAAVYQYLVRVLQQGALVNPDEIYKVIHSINENPRNRQQTM